ncbi:MAG: hypothetical protein ABSC08_15795 [Bryobacteraceae bacterium]
MPKQNPACLNARDARLAMLRALKGHLRAIWLLSPDGGNRIQARAPQGTKYSVVEKLQHGRCWKLRQLDGRDEDGVPFSARNVFLQVVADCMVG